METAPLNAYDVPAPVQAASGSSFYLAMRVLPRPKREAMYAIYGFCRAVDDVADSESPRDERIAALNAWRRQIDRLFEASEVPTQLGGLRNAVRQFGLKRKDFHAVMDGMEMDATADMCAPDWATLDLYCDRVASAVGRLSVRIFGLGEETGVKLAHHLGRALQLTNILRDLDEDAALGRLYLPREALASAGIEATHPGLVLCHSQLAATCSEVVARAQRHFAQADEIMAGCPREVVVAPRLMAAAYRSVLERLERRGWSPPRERVSTDKLRLLGAFFRYSLL